MDEKLYVRINPELHEKAIAAHGSDDLPQAVMDVYKKLNVDAVMSR